MSQKLKQAIILTATYYGQPMNTMLLEAYTEDLIDLPEDRVVSAYIGWRRNPKNTRAPLPAQIRALVEPAVDPESAAREIAGRIAGAVPKFGWANGQEAREYIGEVGWEIVTRQGGWSHLCENLGLTIDPTSFQAQVREQAKAQLTHGHQAMAAAIGLKAPADRKSGELTSVADIIMLPMGKVDRPEGA